MEVTGEDSDDSISYGAIDFPTDHITAKYLRARFPRDPTGVLERQGERLDTAHFIERAFVRYGYGSVMGGRERELAGEAMPPDGDRDESVAELTNLYLHFGIASGPESAKQLIRRLEEAGAALARRQTGHDSP